MSISLIIRFNLNNINLIINRKCLKKLTFLALLKSKGMADKIFLTIQSKLSLIILTKKIRETRNSYLTQFNFDE